AEQLTGEDVVVTLVKDGDHRLSTAADLARLSRTLDELAGR
ncbi:MAG: alpha/beta hydrolase, partial [Stellaceae bacterium]